MAQTIKGFIKDWAGNKLLPITRGELVLDIDGNIALNSTHFLAENGHPGLLTAAERAMLSGTGGSGGISDIYTKLEYINTGIRINEIPVKFYDDAKLTPINIVSTGDGKLSIGVADNTINLGLQELKTTDTVVNNILRTITVDKYGRVVEVTGSPLANNDIPPELTGKTLINGTLNGCLTADDEIGTNTKAVANKGYVDQAIQKVTGLATGALKFAGAIDNADDAVTVVSNANNNNKYYKVTKDFTLSSEYIHSETSTVNWYGKIKSGDTLIVYTNSSQVTKFVHVPSGNDITAITIKEQGEAGNVLTSAIGEVTLSFASLFDIAIQTEGSQTVSIAIPKADSSTDGYLSKADYTLFSSYADSLATSYESIIPDSGAGIYALGTITVGSTPYTIYGKNSTSSLTLNNGTVDAYNPILKFTETSETDVKITYKGINGIQVRKNEDAIEILAKNEVISQTVPESDPALTTQYLTIEDGYKFGVKLGSFNGNTLIDGLTDYSEFNALRNAFLTSSLIFETIDKSLTGIDETATYIYGNDNLKVAVNVTI